MCVRSSRMGGVDMFCWRTRDAPEGRMQQAATTLQWPLVFSGVTVHAMRSHNIIRSIFPHLSQELSAINVATDGRSR